MAQRPRKFSIALMELARVRPSLSRRARKPAAGRSRTSLVESAGRSGWKLTPADRAFLRELEAAIDKRTCPKVAVLVGPKASSLKEVVGRARPNAFLRQVPIGKASRLHTELAAAGPWDVIVDDSRRGRGRGRLFRNTFFHLRPEGRFIVRGFPAGSKDVEERGEETVSDLVSRLMDVRARNEPPTGRREEDELALARAMALVAVDHRHLVVTKTGRSLAKLNEVEVNRVLELRGGALGRLVRQGEPQVLVPRCTLTESPSFRNGGMPEKYDVPALSLREYSDVVCVPGQIVMTENLLLPDTYRHNQRARLGNRFTRELGPRFAVPRADTSPVADLAGSYYYLDSEFRGHFGHALTEQVSRFWAWPEAKRADPGLKALVATNVGREELAAFETALFAAGGIEPGDVELVNGPVRVERLVAATPMLGNPAYVHPDLEKVWSEVGRRLADGAPDREYPRKIFCSRREQTGPGAFTGSRRQCRNGTEVEEMFARHGFAVVYTEEFSLGEQAKMFREAEVIAGYAGSALFNVMFSGQPKRVIVISSESYTAKNEYLIASVLGHRIDLAWCQAEIPMPEGRWDTRAFNSAFTFDFGREGRFLEEILAGL